MRTRGFTLLEVLAALVLTGIVALLARQAVGRVVAFAAAAREAAHRHAMSANAERWLAEALGSARVGERGPIGDAGFKGGPAELQFDTSLLTEEGWAEPASVALQLEHSELVARYRGVRLTLADAVARLEIDYLGEVGLQAPWLKRWYSEASLPVAVRIRLTRVDAARTDTLMLPVGIRG